MAVMDRSSTAPDSLEDLLNPSSGNGARRIEDWLVSQLDGGSTGQAQRSSLDAWRLDRQDAKEERGRRRRGSEATSNSVRLSLARQGNVTIVRVTVSNLVKEDVLADTAEQLDALLAAGAHRLIINFAAVERLSSPMLNAVIGAHERCRQRDGGQLRLVGIRPTLQPLFAVTGLAHTLAIFPDEGTALAAPWPAPREAQPLPLSILAMLKRTGEEGMDPAMARMTNLETSGVCRAPSALRLRFESGRWAGLALTLAERRLRIGRDGTCQLRCSATTVSRFHAEIGPDEAGEVQLIDLGSTNGTLHNGALVRGRGVPLEPGDRLQIGPMRLAVEAHDAEAPTGTLEERVAEWLTGQEFDGDGEGQPSGESEAPCDPPSTRTELECAVGSIRHELIEGVLVVTPRGVPLDDESGVEALRAALQTFLETDLPRRVVVNLETAGGLSSRAIGFLVAHALRLDRLGGALRIAQPQPRARTWLEHLRIQVLVDLFPTLDEAVIAAWD